MTRRELDIAWAAGFFEGEGSFTFQSSGNGRRYLRLSLQSTDLDVLERFHKIVACGTLYSIRVDPRFKNPKPVWQWHARTEWAYRHVYELFRPYLGERRRARALELLVLYGKLNNDQMELSG